MSFYCIVTKMYVDAWLSVYLFLFLKFGPSKLKHIQITVILIFYLKNNWATNNFEGGCWRNVILPNPQPCHKERTQVLFNLLSYVEVQECNNSSLKWWANASPNDDEFCSEIECSTFHKFHPKHFCCCEFSGLIWLLWLSSDTQNESQ